MLPAVAPTCTENGLTEGMKCSVCDATLIAQEEIPALGHTEVMLPAVAPTCTESGLTEGMKCSVCGETLVAQEEIPALGHTEVMLPAVAPTCTENGLTEGMKCSVCGATLIAQEEIPALGHMFIDGICHICGTDDPDYIPDVSYTNTIEVIKTSADDGTTEIQIIVKNVSFAGIRLSISYNGYKFLEAACPENAMYFDNGSICNYVWSSGANEAAEELELLSIRLVGYDEFASEIILEVFEIYEFSDNGDLVVPEYVIVYN